MSQEIITALVKPNDKLPLDAYMAYPSGEVSYPRIVVIQEIFGVNAHIRDVTERIARLGYVATSPTIFQRIAPGFETGYTPQDILTGRSYKGQTKTLSRQQSIISKIVPGHVAYLAATLDDIKATALFYGAGIATETPGGITRTSEINGTLYAFFGMEDASIPIEQVDAIAAELAKAGTSHRIFRYNGAEHGFFATRALVIMK